MSLGLLHGSHPDAIDDCHDATRTAVSGWPDYTVPSVADCIDLNLTLGRRTNPAVRCVGVCVNTSQLQTDERTSYLEGLSSELGLPCVDPVIDGCAAIAELLANA